MDKIILPISIFSLGAVIGSFLEVFTYRYPRKINLIKGRSFCINCKTKIAWYDNIPLFSYLYLKGKCRNCKKAIPLRSPLIEASTASLFLLVFLSRARIFSNVSWLNEFPTLFSILLLLLTASVLIAVFVIDLEHQIILDELVWIGLAALLFTLFFSFRISPFVLFLPGFLAGLFLLFLNIATKGRGMGLGDVKLALFLGSFLGFPTVVSFLFLSFVIGALVGIVLLATSQKGLKDKVAFGPFMVVSFFLCLFFAEGLNLIFFPFINF